MDNPDFYHVRGNCPRPLLGQKESSKYENKHADWRAEQPGISEQGVIATPFTLV